MCCCSLRDPLRGAGVQTGVGSLALEEEGRQLVWCSRGHHSTGGRGARLSFRPGCAGVCACVWDRAGAAKGLAGAGRRAGRGPGCAVRGVPSEKGGRCEGADREVGKRGLTLSLSLSGLSLAPSSAGGAPCTSPRERSVRLLSSVRPSLILILFHIHPPLPPSGAAQTPRHLQRHQKGLCWGACRLYPGLRGCGSSSRRRKEGAESCCLLSVRSGVKATRKESEAWGEGAGCYF